MKKALTILCSIMTLFLCAGQAFAVSEPVLKENDSYSYMTEFVSAYPYRLADSDSIQGAEDYLKSKLDSFGYDARILPEFKFEFQYFDTERNISAVYSGSASNIEAVLDTDSDKQIIIGAHYDNVFSGEKSTEAQGANDNGSGVGVLLALAEYFAGKDIGADIRFVLFGANEYGLYGSADYIANMSEKEISDTLLYINLDGIAAGDYLYMYSDEVPTGEEKYFLNVAKENNYNLEPMPARKGTLLLSYCKKYPYSDIGLLSDNANFISEGINSLSFFSGNINPDSGYGESGMFGNISDTADDNVTKIEKLYGHSAVNKMNTVYSLIVSALEGESFVETMTSVRFENNDFFTARWFSVVLCSLPVLACVAVLVFTFLREKKISAQPPEKPINGETTEEKNDDGKVFEEFGI